MQALFDLFEFWNGLFASVIASGYMRLFVECALLCWRVRLDDSEIGEFCWLLKISIALGTESWLICLEFGLFCFGEGIILGDLIIGFGH